MKKFLSGVSLVFLPVIVKAAELGGLTETADNAGVPKTSLMDYASLVNTFLTFFGVIFLLLMVFAGFQWMTSRGNTKKVDIAKKLIGAAVAGLIVVTAAYAITAFVGDSFGK